jgi:hypothetical protein
MWRVSVPESVPVVFERLGRKAKLLKVKVAASGLEPET